MMIFSNRKGVSEVVANVLIVLLVIVGVAVIWSVVKPTIDKSAKEINTECFNVKVSPVSCAKPSVIPAVMGSCSTTTATACDADGDCPGTETCTGYVAPVPVGAKSTVKRDAGAGQFLGFKVLYEDATGATQVFEESASTLELATEAYTHTLTGTFTPVKMNVAAVVGPNSADKRTCEVLTTPIGCA